MGLKFNGGNGAVVCDGCRTMIADGRHVHHPAAVQTDGPAVEYYCSKDCTGRPRMLVAILLSDMGGDGGIVGVVGLGRWSWRWPVGNDAIHVSLIPVRKARPIERDGYETRGFQAGASHG